MRGRKMFLQVLLAMALVLSLVVPASVVGALRARPPLDNHPDSHLAADSSSLASAMALNTLEGSVKPMVAAGNGYTVGLKSDGTVVAVGDDRYGQCDVDGWTDIIQVAADSSQTVGLKSDGTVVAVGNNGAGQCDVGGWNLIAGGPPINWLLFSGIVAVVVLGLVTFFVRRRRAARTRGG